MTNFLTQIYITSLQSQLRLSDKSIKCAKFELSTSVAEKIAFDRQTDDAQVILFFSIWTKYIEV